MTSNHKETNSPFPQQAEESKTNERQLQVDRAALIGVLTRVVSIAAQLCVVPIALSALGTDQFAVWAVITSAVSILLFFDFGVGNGAMGRITESLARHDHEAVVSWIKHSYILLTTFAITLIVLVVSIYYSGILTKYTIRSDSFLIKHTGLIASFIAIYALIIPCSFIQRIFFAYQRAGWASVMQLIFSLIYLAVAAASAKSGLGLTAFVIGYALVMLTVFGAFTVWGLYKILPKGLKQQPVRWTILSTLLKDGSLFFLLQVTVALVYNSDALILSLYVAPSEVAMYAMTFRMFTIVMTLNALMLGPLWPAIGDALARGEIGWVRRAYTRNRLRSFILSVTLASLLIIYGHKLLEVWTHGQLSAPISLLMLMAIWVILEGYGQCMAMLLNAMRIIRLQVIVALLLLVIGTMAKIWLAGSLGFYGPMFATVCTFILIVAVPETYFISKLMAENK